MHGGVPLGGRNGKIGLSGGGRNAQESFRKNIPENKSGTHTWANEKR